MKKATKRTTKTRRAVTAVLCLSVALTGGAAVGLASYGMSQGEGYYYVAEAEEGTAVTDLFSVVDTANYYEFAGLAPYTNETNFYCVTLKFNDATGKIGDVGNLQNFSVGDKVLGDYIVIKKKGGDAKTVTEWNSLDANNVKRIHGYGQTILFGCDNPGNLNIDQIEYITFKSGFRLFDGNADATTRDGWIGFPAEGTEKAGSIFKRDLTLVVNNTTKCFEPAVAGYPDAVGQNALTVTTEPDKKQYVVGEDFDVTGMKITALLDGGETREIAVTDTMVSYNFATAGNSNVTISYGGGSVTYGVTVVEPEKLATSVTVKEGGGLTAKKYTLPSEFGIVEGTKITVAYDDGSSEEKDFALTMLKDAYDASGKAKAGVVDTSTAGKKQATFTYEEGATVLEGTIQLTVSEEARESYLTGASYGTSSSHSGGFGADFTWISGGQNGLRAIDGLRNLASLIPGKTLGDLVQIKFEKQAEPIALNDSGIAALTPAFYGGTFVIRDTSNISADTYGNIEYIIIKEGFVWYNAPEDHWGAGNNADTVGFGYYPIGTNYVTKDLYIGSFEGQTVKPIQSLSVSVSDETPTFIAGQSLTDNDLTGITYTAQYLDPAETTPLTGNVTAAMCSSVPTEVGDGSITVTLLGKTTTFSVNVVAAEKTVESVEANFTLTANKFALPSQIVIPDNAKITVNYSDNTSEDVAFTFNMLGVAGNAAGIIDTSTAGNKTLNFTYSYAGFNTTGTVTLTVSDTAQTSAITGINYGATGLFSGNRTLPFTTQGVLNAKITYVQESYASLIPGLQLSDLIYIKFANQESEISYSSLSDSGVFDLLRTKWSSNSFSIFSPRPGIRNLK